MADERLKAKRKAVESGAVETTVREWLGLDDSEMAVVELRVRIAKEVRRRREAVGLTQAALADRIGVAPPRVASIEDAASASLDTLALAYFATGSDLADLAASIVGQDRPDRASAPAEATALAGGEGSGDSQ